MYPGLNPGLNKILYLQKSDLVDRISVIPRRRIVTGGGTFGRKFPESRWQIFWKDKRLVRALYADRLTFNFKAAVVVDAAIKYDPQLLLCRVSGFNERKREAETGPSSNSSGS